MCTTADSVDRSASVRIRALKGRFCLFMDNKCKRSNSLMFMRCSNLHEDSEVLYASSNLLSAQ